MPWTISPRLLGKHKQVQKIILSKRKRGEDIEKWDKTEALRFSMRHQNEMIKRGLLDPEKFFGKLWAEGLDLKSESVEGIFEEEIRL